MEQTQAQADQLRRVLHDIIVGTTAVGAGHFGPARTGCRCMAGELAYRAGVPDDVLDAADDGDTMDDERTGLALKWPPRAGVDDDEGEFRTRPRVTAHDVVEATLEAVYGLRGLLDDIVEANDGVPEDLPDATRHRALRIAELAGVEVEL